MVLNLQGVIKPLYCCCVDPANSKQCALGGL